MGWGGRLNRIKDNLHHALDILVDLGVPEPHRPEPLCTKPLIPSRIPQAAMPAAIRLDHQPTPQIGEIRYERPDRGLPPEMKAKHPVQLAQACPERPLLRRHLRPQFPRPLPGDGLNTGHAPRPMPTAPHPIPPHKGEGAPTRPPPALRPTD